MYLYQLTLQRSSAICCAVHGNFSSPKEQEIVVSHGEHALPLWLTAICCAVYGNFSEDSFFDVFKAACDILKVSFDRQGD